MPKAYYDCPTCKKPALAIGRNRAEADRKARHYEQTGRLCEDCRKAEFVAQHASSVAAAATDPLTAALPALTGSEKQIGWAQALRLEALPRIHQAKDGIIAQINESDWPDAIKTEVTDAVILLSLDLINRTSASAWIDGRVYVAAAAYRTLIEGAFRARKADLCPQWAEMMAAREQGNAES